MVFNLVMTLIFCAIRSIERNVVRLEAINPQSVSVFLRHVRCVFGVLMMCFKSTNTMFKP